MFAFWGAEEFLRRVISHRVVWLRGEYGTGKTGQEVLLSYWLHSIGMVDHTISNVPIAWMTPFELAPLFRVCVIADELGVMFDARGSADREQNQFRKDVLAYLRKLGVIFLLGSRVAPDVSFRGLSSQRLFDFTPFGIPVELYSWVFEDQEQFASGHYWLWRRGWLWSKHHPSLLYSTGYVPNGKRLIQDWFQRAVAAVRLDDDMADVAASGLEEVPIEELQRWYRVEPSASAN